MQSSLFVQLISANDYQEGKYNQKKALQEYSFFFFCCPAMVNIARADDAGAWNHSTASHKEMTFTEIK